MKVLRKALHLLRKALRLVIAAAKNLLRDPNPLSCVGEVWCGSGDDNMVLIAGLARSTRAKRYLEIGAYRGFTAGFVRWACPGVEVHAIDNWQRADTSSQQLLDGVARISGGADGVVIHEGESQEQLQKLLDLGLTFDLIYVDGCHTHQAAKADFEMALKLLTPSGTVVVDDTVTWWGPRQLSEELQENGIPAGFQLLEITTSNGLLIMRKRVETKPPVVLTPENCPDGIWKDEAPPQLRSA